VQAFLVLRRECLQLARYPCRGERGGQLGRAAFERHGQHPVLDSHALESGSLQQRAQVGGERQAPRAARVAVGEVVACYLSDGLGQHGERGALLDALPDRDPDPAARAERAPHLGQRCEPVGKELQALLAGRDVEALVRNRQPVRGCLGVVDGRAASDRSPALGDREHRRAHITTRHPPRRPAPGRREPGDRPRAAGNIEDRLARLERELPQELAPPRLEHPRHHHLRVDVHGRPRAVANPALHAAPGMLAFVIPVLSSWVSGVARSVGQCPARAHLRDATWAGAAAKSWIPPILRHPPGRSSGRAGSHRPSGGGAGQAPPARARSPITPRPALLPGLA